MNKLVAGVANENAARQVSLFESCDSRSFKCKRGWLSQKKGASFQNIHALACSNVNITMDPDGFLCLKPWDIKIKYMTFNFSPRFEHFFNL